MKCNTHQLNAFGKRLFAGSRYLVLQRLQIPLIKFMIALVFVFIAVSCASIPVQDLKTYTTSFNEVGIAGNLILDEISPIVSDFLLEESAAEREVTDNDPCSDPADGFPPCFNPDHALREAGILTNEDDSITARRAALETVTIYNSLLVALVEGHSAEEVSRQFDQLIGFVDVVSGGIGPLPLSYAGVVPLAKAGINLFKGLAIRLEQGRANKTVRQSLISSKDDIKAVIRLWMSDLPNIYTVYRRGQELEIGRLETEKNRARIRKDKGAFENTANAVFELKGKLTAFHESLGQFTQLLVRTEQSLDTLVRAASNTQVSAADANAILNDVVEIRVAAEAFFNIFREVQLPD